MGSKPKAPDMSAQNKAAADQAAELKSQQEEARVANAYKKLLKKRWPQKILRRSEVFASVAAAVHR